MRNRAAWAALVWLFAATGGAEPLDPTLAQRWVVGTPRGSAPLARIDAERTGRTREPLPARPRVLWRARVQGGIAFAPVVDERGSLLAASPIASITQIGQGGKVLWTARTGATPAATSPVLTSDGTRVVLTQGGELLGFDASGSARFARTLPIAPVRAIADPLPLEDGGLLVSSGRTALRLDKGGAVQARASVDADVTALLGYDAAMLLVTERGDVHAWRPPAEPSRLASFAGRVEGAARAGKSLVAVVDQSKLVVLDLATGSRQERLELPLGLSPWPALLADGGSRVVSFDGQLLGHDRNDNEAQRTALEPPSAPGPGLTAGAASPPLIVDLEGRTGFVRPGLPAGVADRAGRPAVAEGAACLDPIAVVPAGKLRMLLACRSGAIWMLGQRPGGAEAADAEPAGD
jgi:hypothetical protein